MLFTPRRTAGIAATVVGALAVGSLVVFASRSPGYANTSVNTQPKTAWVTSGKDLMLGLLNQQIDEVESPLVVESPESQLMQSGESVVLVDPQAQTARRLDVSNVQFTGKVKLPESAATAMSATTFAVVDRQSGQVWALPLEGFGGADLTTAQPSATLPGKQHGGAVVTVSGSTVTAVEAGGNQQVQFSSGGDGPSQGTPTPIPGEPLSSATPEQPEPIAIASVGDQAVILDRVTGRIIVGDKEFRLPEGTKQATLQQSGPAASSVLISSADALLAVDLSTGATASTPVTASGAPAAPVRAGECVYGAWGGKEGAYLRQCGEDSFAKTFKPQAADAPLVFRVNGSTVVLNDLASGDVWTPVDDQLRRVNNWDKLKAKKEEGTETDSAEEGKARTVTQQRKDCTDGVVPAQPKNDKITVRPGQPQVLPVLRNDTVSSCSVPVITKVEGGGPGVAVIVDNGQAVQVTLPKEQSSPLNLKYYVNVGEGPDVAADLTVVPHTGDPIAPKMVRESSAGTVPGGTVTTDVLGDWISPSGDPLFLVNAEVSGDDVVSFTPDGAITFVDSASAGVANKTVRFTVSDGTSRVNGTLMVEVHEPRQIEPAAAAFLVTGVAGKPVVAEPLNWVTWFGEERATLAKVTPQRGSGVTVGSIEHGTVTLTGATPGTYYLDYEVAAGSKAAKGVIRFDVREAPKKIAAPITTVDLALVPVGGEVLVDLTRNDRDPAGGVVAVQELSLPQGSPLVAQLIDLHLVKISARQPLPAGGLWVPYTASAGGESATGYLHVVSVPVRNDMVPVVEPIELTVRAGQAITVPISTYAKDPAGQALTPVPFADDAIAIDAGLLFATDEAIRFVAPSTGPYAAGKTIRTQYTVINSGRKKASAPLTITIVKPEGNQPPRQPVTAYGRAFAGGTVEIPLALAGIDPDGDWVIVDGIETPAERGRATAIGTAAVRYTAFGEPGIDTFTYTASDAAGEKVTGTVQVLVVPLPKIAKPPILADLQVEVAPSRSLAVNVLDNATDPAGQALSFVDKDAVKVPADSGITAKLRGNSVVVTAWDREGTWPITVTIQNKQGRTASGRLTVTVTPKATKVPPVAKDVVVTAKMLAPDNRSAKVDVSRFVANPGGLPEELKTDIPTVSNGRLTAAGNLNFTAKITEERQILAYRVRNLDKLSAEAFIVVPSRSELNLAPPPPEELATEVAQTEPPSQTPTESPSVPPSQPPRKTPATSAPPTSSPKLNTPLAPTRSSPAPTPTPTTQSQSPEPTVPKEVLKPESGGLLEVDAGETVTVKIGDYISGAPEGRSLAIAPGTTPTATIAGSKLTVSGPDTFVWVVPEEAAGDGNINLTVTDTVAAPAKTYIPVRVRAKKPAAPTFQGTAIPVEPNKTSAPVDLLGLVTYDQDKLNTLKFSAPTGGRGGITAAVEGTRLTVTAAASVAKGTTATFTVTVTDALGQSATAEFPVSVTGSQEPLATVPDKVGETQAGKPLAVNMVQGATNPFPDTPLRVVSATAGNGYAAVVGADGATVTVTPTVDFSGQAAVQVTVEDATKDPDRRVQATLTVTVKGKPEAPRAVREVSHGDQTATIQWTDGADNGAPITKYLVTANGFSQECTKNPCKLDGLTNNKEYQFTVIAVNEVGQSPPSPPSAVIRPDVSPETPSAPKLAFGDKQLTATWVKPDSKGSPITGYELQLTPGQVVKIDGGDKLTHVFPNLENGTSYTVKVRALNAADAPSEWSAVATEIPAAAPGVPPNVKLSAADASGANKRIDVAWAAAAANGDAPAYEIAYKSSQDSGTIPVPAGQLTGTFPAVVGVEYTVQVRAKNKAGPSAFSPAQTVVPYTAPGVIGDLAAAATGEPGGVNLTWSAPPDNGRTIEGYWYSVDGGQNWQPAGGASPFAVPGLENGKDYNFVVRACSKTDTGTDNCAGPSNQASANPYSQPSAPQAVAANPDPAPAQVVVSWQAPADAGGRTVQHYVVSGDNGVAPQTIPAGTLTATFGGLENGKAYNFTVVAVTDAPSNNTSAGAGAAATPYDEPAAPQGLTAAGGENQIVLNWGAPVGDGGRPISGWEYQMDGGRWAGANPGMAVPVGNWNPHTFVVRAVNQRGAGRASNQATAKAYGPVKGVNNLRKTGSGQRSIAFAWDPPDGNGVGGFTYQHKRAAESNWKDVGTAQDSNEGGLECGKTYNIQVRATDAQGHVGPETTVEMGTDACPPPPAPPAVQLAKGASAPNCGGCYYLRVNYQNLPAGSYDICFHFDREGAGCWRSYTRTLSGDGFWSTSSMPGGYYGYPTTGWVRVSGPVTVQSPDKQW